MRTTVYRQVRADEIQKLGRAEEYCFFIDPADYAPFMEQKMRPEYLRGIFGDDDELKAGLINFPFRVYMGGARVPMGGVAGVVSWPEYRREGNVGELLVHLLKEEKEKGVPLSALGPFKQSFYRQYGWEVAFSWLRLHIPVELLLGHRSRSGVVKRFAPGTADWTELQKIYSAKFQSRYGYIVRGTKQFWTDWVFWGPPVHTAVWYPAPGQPAEGYLLYRFEKDDRGDQEFVIQELVALNPTAERGLWGYAAQHDSQVKFVRHRTFRDYPVWHLVENTRDVKMQLVSGWMLRLVDIKAAFESRPWDGTPDASFIIGVKDPQLPWNDGSFRMTFEGGRCTLTPAPAEIPVLAADQRLWAQLYSGLVRPDQAVSTGRLSCSDFRALDTLSAAVAGKELWFYESF